MMATSRMTSGDELKYWSGLAGLVLDLRLISYRQHPLQPRAVRPHGMCDL